MQRSARTIWEDCAKIARKGMSPFKNMLERKEREIKSVT